MFYIVHFFKFIYIKGFGGYLFLIFTAGLLTVALSYNVTSKMIRDQFRVQKSLPYFHALISSGRNIDAIKDKLINVAGVQDVRIKSASHLKQQTKELLVDLGLKELYQDENYYGLQVFLDVRLAQRTYTLVKEYLIRLLGKKNITLSRVKGIKTVVQKNRESSFRLIHQWGYWAILGVAGILWVLSLLGITSDFKRYCYLIEEYQRRENTFPRVMMIGPLVLLVLLGAIFVSFSNINYFHAIGVTLSMMGLSCIFCFKKGWS